LREAQQDRVVIHYPKEKHSYTFPKSDIGEFNRVDSKREIGVLRLRRAILKRYLASLHGEEKAEAITALISRDDFPRFLNLDDLAELERTSNIRNDFPRTDQAGAADYEGEQEDKRLSAWREACLR